MDSVLELTELSDIDVKVGSQNLALHSAILCQSTFFRKIITDAAKNTEAKTLEIELDMAPELEAHVCAALKSLYGIYPAITESSWFEYLSVSAYLLIPDLNKLVGLFLSSYIYDANVIEFMNFAYIYDISGFLYSRCFSYLLQRLCVLKTQIGKLPPAMAKNLIESEALWLAQAEDIKELATLAGLPAPTPRPLAYIHIDLSPSAFDPQVFHLSEAIQLKVYIRAASVAFFDFTYTDPHRCRILIPSFKPLDQSAYIQYDQPSYSSVSGSTTVDEFIVDIAGLRRCGTVLYDLQGAYLPVIVSAVPDSATEASAGVPSAGVPSAGVSSGPPVGN